LAGLVDPTGRRLTHLRLQVTQRCDLACAYCHREGAPDVRGEMDLPLLGRIVDALGRLGMTHAKITGGEPLLRADVVDVVARIHGSGHFSEVSLTTNGTRLAGLARGLKQAGLARVNIGCDSLSSSITPKTIDRVRPGLEAALEAGLAPVKLNMVVMRGVNDHEIDDLMRLAATYQAILQLIELIPTSPGDRFHARYHVPLAPIRERLASRATAVRVRQLQGREQFDVDGATVEIVSPFHRSFCGACSKLRVTADGRLMPCLVSGLTVPFEGEESVARALALRAIPERSRGCD
jgi:cyclic pyranopterin phosphate synthase